MKKKIIIWIILVAVVIGGVFYFLKPKKTESKYITAKAIVKNIEQTVSVTGEIVPVSQMQLSFEITGTIKNIPVEIGDKVVVGQEIATLDDATIQAQLNEAVFNLKTQEENLKLKRRKWDDYKPEEKASFKLAVDKAQASVNVIQSQLDKYTLTSPVGGVIIKKYIDKNEIVKATIPVVEIMEDDDLEIEANISEADIAKVELGQEAKVTFDAFSADDIFTAKVTKIEPASTVIQDVVYYKVTFDILKNEKNTALFDKLRVGMSADLDILTARKSDVLTVPTQAVKTEDGKKYVDILIKKDRKEEIKKVKVETGLRGDDGMVEIISGLNAGDEAVTFVKEK